MSLLFVLLCAYTLAQTGIKSALADSTAQRESRVWALNEWLS